MDESRNPKNVAARGRVQVALLPAAGVIHGAHACMEGARKYGPYNWRDEKIALMAYASAALRHIQRFVDGEDVDADSGCHHLGHAIATCAIALDAMECDAAIDDRPRAGAASDVLKRLSKGELEQVAVEAAAMAESWRDAQADRLDALAEVDVDAGVDHGPNPWWRQPENMVRGEVVQTPTETAAELTLRNKYGHTWEYLTHEDRVRLIDLECRRIRDEERERAALSAVERKAAELKWSRQQTALYLAQKRFADGHKYVDPIGEQKADDICRCTWAFRRPEGDVCAVCKQRVAHPADVTTKALIRQAQVGDKAA